MRTCLFPFSRCLGWLLAGLLWSGFAHAQAGGAQNGGAPSEYAQLEQMARDWVQPAMAAAVGVDGGGQLRPEILMGSLDARLRLAPCARIEPYLPPGTRLWGRSRVGLRCLEGPVRWNVFMPVTVKAWGPGWVIKRPVAAGSVLTQEDAELADMDWAEQPYAVLANPDRWVGQQAAYALQPGQAIRQNMVRPTPAFGPGAQVRVSSAGAGFQVVVSGEALTAGVPGQNVRVRLSGGRIVTGTVRDGQTVDVRL
jgi:flagellar basal body P-ring formation protein FlgA